MTIDKEYCPWEDGVMGLLFILWLASVSMFAVVGFWALFAIAAVTSVIEMTETFIKTSRGEEVPRLVAFIWTGS